MTATTTLAEPRARRDTRADVARANRTRPQSAAAWNFGATTVIWATSLVIAMLWVSGHGVQDLFTLPAQALDSLGRLTGLIASNLLLYQVLLMARVPLFERGFGRDGITRMHRLVGFWSLWLMLGHIVLITIGYAAGANVVAEFVDLVLEYPAMLLALAGTVAIIAVGITSMRAARRRMRYESWHLLHLYGYLGVGLALPHQLWTGSDFLGSPLATAYWWTLWAVTAAAVVGWRVLAPIVRNLRWGLRVRSVVSSGTDAVTITAEPRHGRRVAMRSGQFFVWRVPGGPSRLRGTPVSTSRLTDGAVSFTVRVVGDGTARLARLQPGQRLWAEGPYGTLTADRLRAAHTVMFGAGSGVAPLVGILQTEGFDPARTVLVTRDHAIEGGVMPSAVQDLVDRHGLRHFALDGPRDPSASSWAPANLAHLSAQELLLHLAPKVRDADILVVGPAAWMAALRHDLRAAGVPADRIHTENFSI